MTLRHLKWIVWLGGSLLTLSGMFINKDGATKRTKRASSTHAPVAANVSYTSTKPLGGVYIPGHMDETESWFQIQTLINLQTQCRNRDLRNKAGYNGWPRPSYYYSAEADVKYCQLTQTKVPFWQHFFKILKRRLTKGKFGKNIDLAVVDYGNKSGTSSKTILMVRNPFSRLLNGYIEKYLLGSNICRETSFQVFLDSVITGIKLRINLGLVFTPIYSLCLPCENYISSVITYENFDSDLQYTIAALDVPTNVAKQVLNVSAKFQNTGETVNYLTALGIKSYKTRKCTNITELAIRLVEAFRLKGFTSGSEVMRRMMQLIETNVGVSEMTYNVERLANKNLLRRHSDDTATKTAQSDAYRDIAQETIKYILDIYDFEFDAFKYDRVP